MREKNLYVLCGLLSVSSTLRAEVEDSTLLKGQLPEVNIFAMPKENAWLAEQPVFFTALSEKDMYNKGVGSMKDLTALVPNLYMPDYGSRLTSTISIRGMAARIGQPSVGLYVNDIPVLDKSAYDFDFYDIDHLQVLGGAQGTLYGRNTIGGLINVYTKNPFDYQGTDIRLGGASKENAYKASLAHYHRLSSKFAFSTSGFFQHSQGFFENQTLHESADKSMSGGGKVNAFWKPSALLKLNALVGYEYSDENGYAYGQYDPKTSQVGPVLSNPQGNYYRGLLNAGLNVSYNWKGMEWRAVTGYQHLDDRMLLDQDFTAANIFTLTQKQRVNSVSQELYLKSRSDSRWQWTTGLFGFYQSLRTLSPVEFQQEGMDWLGNQINSAFSSAASKGVLLGLRLNDPSLRVGGTFRTPSWNVAAFHQSTVRDVLVKGLSVTVGLRLEHESQRLKYDSSTKMGNYDFTFDIDRGKIPIPAQIYRMLRLPWTMSGLSSEADYKGSLKHAYTELLPKFSVQYEWQRQQVYLSATKGYRSGGYNIQMFSDISQYGLRSAMTRDAAKATLEKVASFFPHGGGESVIQMVEKLLPQGASEVDASATAYEPEYSWNYEAGGHFSFFNGAWKLNAAAFYTTLRNAQITRFVDSGLGRQMVNAGKVRSYGFETGFQADLCDGRLLLNGSYGFTKAVFSDYDAGDGRDYTGNEVPFTPRHTFSFSTDYHFRFRSSLFKGILLGASVQGAGRIYWTERNEVSQPFYATLRAHTTLDMGCVKIDVWGCNLTNTHYNSFYFENMGNGFAQIANPVQAGVDITLHF